MKALIIAIAAILSWLIVHFTAYHPLHKGDRLVPAQHVRTMLA